MEALFNRDKISNVVLVGMGNLGLALSRYSTFCTARHKHRCHFRH